MQFHSFTLIALSIIISMTCAAGIGAEDLPNWPDGYAVAAYLDCGSQDRAGGEQGLSLGVSQGHSFTFPGVEGSMGSAAMDEKGVVLEAGGLAANQEYVVAICVWDADNAGRVQSVTLSIPGTTPERILPPAPAKAFYQDKPTWAVILFPLTVPANSSEPVRFEIHCESGPNAVLNEAWLLRKQDAVARKSILIVTGDDYPGHLWRETAPTMAAALREDPELEVSITESPMILGSPLLRHYDAVMIHFKNYAERLTLGEEVRNGLKSYVEHGGGVMISHFGCGAFQEWDQFVQVAGRVWNPAMRAHDPYGSFEVRMTDPQHPVTRGLETFTTTDEMYTCLDGAPAIHVLCEAISVVDQKVYPVAFTLEAEHPRLVHCTLGHDRNALSTPGARELYKRAARWVAGLSGS
jgi:uncharacterized protein